MRQLFSNHRDQNLYPQLFGELISRHPLHPQFFERNFEARPSLKNVERCSCLLFDDGRVRTAVSSGLTDEYWTKKSKVAGLGMEFLLRTESRADWPIETVLILTALQLMIISGAFGDAEMVWELSRVPLAEPLPSSGDRWTGLFVGPWSLESVVVAGRHFALFAIIPVSTREMDFANEHGGAKLLANLKNETPYPVVDLHRPEVI